MSNTTLIIIATTITSIAKQVLDKAIKTRIENRKGK